MVLVGGGEVGKTTLCKCLRGIYTSNLQASDFTTNQMTDGIEVHKVNITNDSDEKVTFSVFDFAGQKEYAHTHALFFNDSAIYLLMYKPSFLKNHRSDNKATEQKLAEFKEYLLMIKDFAPNATFLVVITHADKLSKEELASEKKSLQQSIGSSANKRSDSKEVEFICVDSIEGTNIDSLKKSLVTIASKQKGVKVNVPGTLVDLETKLASSDYEKKISITSEVFQNIGKSLIIEVDEHRFIHVYKNFC